MNMETTHPGITQDFDDGIISIRRTSKPFSASAIDLTLEQTQNKDAANSSTGKKFIYEYIAYLWLILPLFFIRCCIGDKQS